MGRTVFVLRSGLSPEAVAEALGRSIDEEHWTLFSMSGYKGDRPILGEVRKNTFRVQKRRYSRNDFAGHFYGCFAPEPGGTRIEGYFDAPRWARYFMRIWLGFAVVVGVPIFVETAVGIGTRSHSSEGGWVGLIVPPTLILCGTVLPRIGRLLGESDRRFILENLRTILAARLEESQS
jgi:hypothetical protein